VDTAGSIEVCVGVSPRAQGAVCDARTWAWVTSVTCVTVGLGIQALDELFDCGAGVQGLGLSDLCDCGAGCLRLRPE
jgi:hypothetical protein